MGIGSYLSESFTQKNNQSAIGGVVMLFSYFFAGFIPLTPYLFFPVSQALYVSIFISISALLILGAVSAKISNKPIRSQAIKMFFLGGSAILIGITVGKIMRV